jgi:hypothetical protein
MKVENIETKVDNRNTFVTDKILQNLPTKEGLEPRNYFTVLLLWNIVRRSLLAV